MEQASKLILSCVYLHNFLLLRNDDINLPPSEIERMIRKYKRKFKVESQDGQDAPDLDSDELTRSKLLRFITHRRGQNQLMDDDDDDAIDHDGSNSDGDSDSDNSILPEDL